MFILRNFNNKKSGFSLVEMMIFILILIIVGLTFYKVFTTGTQAMSNVRSRLGAIQLANEKIEIIHNLKYEDIGTKNGIPAGDLDEDEILSKSGKTYYVHTSVVAVDDPIDGTLSAGTDTRPSDYKQIKVIVYWENNNPAKATTVVATISPPGVEAMYTGGILSINVVDSTGVGVSQAHITIINNSVSPSVNADYTTDTSGNLFLPEAKPSVQTYSLQLSKSGYYSAQTYAPYPTSTVNPIDTHASVVIASINQKTIVLDKISKINLFTKTPLGVVVPNIDFSLAGGRKIANTVVVAPAVSQPVWSYSQTSSNSGAEGKVEFPNVSPGPYYFTYPAGTENDKYEFLYFDVAGETTSMFNLSPDVDLNANAILADKNAHSLLVTVLNNAGDVPIVGATVQLKNESATYDVTLTTNKFGKVYFPDSSAALTAGDYKMTVTATGFTKIENHEVTINKLTKEEVKLLTE
jgi:competence protein ComGC